MKKSGYIISESTKLFSLLLIAVLYISCSSDDDGNRLNSTLREDIANQAFVEIIENNISSFPNNTQIAIGIIDNTTTEYLGVINDNNVWQGTSNSSNIFEIGSITKVFTSICLSNLINSNEASLTETLEDQFNFPLQSGSSINLQQLANHTSGLPRLPTNVDEIIGFNANDPYAEYSAANLESYFQNHVDLNAPNGTQYEYSNLGMGLLGYILAKKANTSFEMLMNDIIFNPLQMTSTSTLLTNVDPTDLVSGLDKDGAIVSNWNFAETMSGAGSIKSSIADLEKFVRKNFEDDPIYNLPQATTFNIAEGFKIGLGWHIIEDEGFRVLVHDGGTAGYTSQMMIDKTNKRAVIVLSNVSATTHPDSQNIAELCSSLLEQISFVN